MREGSAGTKRRPHPPTSLVSMQENRSFDHYYGFAPQVQAARFRPPALATRSRTSTAGAGLRSS